MSKKKPFDYITPGVIYGVWTLLIVFGIMTLLQPKWLQEIGDQGRIEEALGIKEHADLALKDRRYARAIKLYNDVLRIDPENNDSIGNIALAHRELGHYDKALNLLTKLAKKYPQQAHLNYLNIAEVYKKKGNKEKTAEFYIKSSRVSPEPDYALFRAANIFMELENYDKALELVSKGISFRTNFVKRYEGMLKRDVLTLDEKPEIKETLLNQLESESYKKDLKLYDRTFFASTLRKDRDLARAYNIKGICYYYLGDLKEAKSNLSIAFKINPNLTESKKYLNLIEKSGI